MGIFLNIFVVVVGLFGLLAFYEIFFGIQYGCENPITIWKSQISDKDFNKYLDEMFSDPRIERSNYEVLGGGHLVWIANKYYAFRFDDYGSSDISFLQKRRFFKRFNKEIEKIRDVSDVGWSWRNR